MTDQLLMVILSTADSYNISCIYVKINFSSFLSIKGNIFTVNQCISSIWYLRIMILTEIAITIIYFQLLHSADKITELGIKS